MHVVAVVATDGVIPFDLATPCDVLRRVLLPDRSPAYEIRVCAEVPDVRCGVFDLHVRHSLAAVAAADTVILPGILDTTVAVSTQLIAAVRDAAERGARIASICTGAFTLAATGLLDGLEATTHWCAAADLARRYPQVRVNANVLYIDNGQVLTSAGAAAGLDLCLHLVRCDFGAAVAAHAARLSVVPLERDGGQAQFIVQPSPPEEASLQPLLRWIEAHLDVPMTLEHVAGRAGMSIRTLSRRFSQQVGETPRQWIVRARVRRAQALLETSTLAVEQVGAAVGFESPAAFRDRFGRIVGTNPQAYRRAFASRHRRGQRSVEPAEPNAR